MNNVTVILFGATGELARRMIIPSLYRLYAQKKIGPFLLIGVAKRFLIKENNSTGTPVY